MNSYSEATGESKSRQNEDLFRTPERIMREEKTVTGNPQKFHRSNIGSPRPLPIEYSSNVCIWLNSESVVENLDIFSTNFTFWKMINKPF